MDALDQLSICKAENVLRGAIVASDAFGDFGPAEFGGRFQFGAQSMGQIRALIPGCEAMAIQPFKDLITPEDGFA
ncbi:MAG: hypothetical protein IPP78_07035 [Holophagaceae bacterium]|nr:hypothetical protein [Holophagaceae bacterium]